ncbi:HNH endonuclease [Methanorbis rubei]|uniref:HNH nuclease domain-containing protein n=1 Tax=Methanorbis rubei TaxID=3028300 RepID=A0AAE4SE94_9EURY|nr:hypothetical protein [Methanocorpusculaceae archaeon Cs1]
MRVHGDQVICRRTNIPHRRNYKYYEDDLREDFHNMCGYCGKSREISSRDFHIDHFVPKSQAPERETDYNNLVYCCCVCNWKKSDKWPTGDPSIPHNGDVGFSDPASDEFDTHLMRDEETGEICPKTDVGSYICNTFNFSTRPIHWVWKAEQLQKLINQFNKRISTLSQEEYKKYALINSELGECKKIFLDKE